MAAPNRATRSGGDQCSPNQPSSDSAPVDPETVMWEMSVDLLAIANQEGFFTRVSPSWERALGHSMETMTGRPYIEFVHPEDVADTLAAAAELSVPGHVTIGFDCRYRAADGSYHWLDWNVQVTDQGELYCIARDVTELRKAQDELRVAARYTRRLIEASLDPLITVNANGAITDVNEAAEIATGRTRGDLIGSDFGDYFTDPAAARGAYEEAFARGRVTDVPLAIRHLSGPPMHVVFNATVYRDDRGYIAGVFAAARDVTKLRQVSEALRAESQFRLAMEYSASAMCLVAPDGRFLRGNQAITELLGRSEAELQRSTWQQLTHPDDLDTDLTLLGEILDGTRDRYRLVKRYLRPDGEVIWGDLSVGAVRNADGTVHYLVSHIIDITERVRAEVALAEREGMLRLVLDNSAESVMRIDRDLRIEYVNERVAALAGIPMGEWLGKTFKELGFAHDLCELWDGHHRRVFDTGEPVTYEYDIENLEGHRWYEVTATPDQTGDDEIEHIVTTAWDITSRKASDAELQHLATRDPLTGLANRTALVDEIHRALSAGRRADTSTAVLLLDLDRFKNVNDSLGHAVGDALLRAAADRMLATVRGSDLVARAGGDEFVVVMRDLAAPSEAFHGAWRLVSAFREPFTIEGAEMFTTASIGVAIASNGSQPDDLVREADSALYVAKEDGRDRVSVFNEELRAAATARLTIEGELRHALERDELEVWYQPEIELSSGRVVAVEALLRWRRPNGVIFPAEQFIGVAEDTGLILSIGDWVLQQVCAQAAAWARMPEHAPLTVRVNLSAVQLNEAGLLDSVDRALSDSELDPAVLCVEITETALLRETAVVRENLAGLRSRGIQIAVDDFGTGYASLAYLRDYPVHLLKIDRSFVSTLTTSSRSHGLVAGIVALADALGISVTAEGVETQAQTDVLRALRCPGAQGFLYSPAVPSDELTSLLGRRFDRVE